MHRNSTDESFVYRNEIIISFVSGDHIRRCFSVLYVDIAYQFLVTIYEIYDVDIAYQFLVTIYEIYEHVFACVQTQYSLKKFVQHMQ